MNLDRQSLVRASGPLVHHHEAENTFQWGKDHCMAGLQFKKTGFDQKESMLSFECSDTVETKLENRRPVMLPPTLSVISFKHNSSVI